MAAAMTGKTVLIAGGTSGIGGRSAAALARLRPFQSTPDQVARSTVALASDPAFAEKTGLYVAPPAKIIKSSKDSYDEAAGQRMFDLSIKMVGL